MNPFTYISNISRNNKSNVDNLEKLNNPNITLFKSPEIIAILVFAGIYSLIRIIEIYIMPLIPTFFTREISSLFRWGPILIPIIFGITFFTKSINNKVNTTHNNTYNNSNYDDILKKRMVSWRTK